MCNKLEFIELDTTNTLTDGRFMFIILWHTRKIKSLVNPKDKKSAHIKRQLSC